MAASPSAHLEERIIALGQEFFRTMGDQCPSLFRKDWWAGKVMDWAMANEGFKVSLFRFVDVLPCIRSEESLLRHVEDYFGADQELPAVLRWGLKHAGLGGGLAMKLLARGLRANIEAMARQFIVGENLDEALASIRKLRHDAFAFTVDILGESAVSEAEATAYQQSYLRLLDALAAEQHAWPALASDSDRDWQQAPKINVSIKPTALFSQADPVDFDNSVAAIVNRFAPIVARARAIGAFVHIDMEQHRYKDITIAVYKELRQHFADFTHLGLVLQAYLPESDQDLERLILWARRQGLPIHIRLVKGAYWDYETIVARQNNRTPPVYQQKWQSDDAFERLARRILTNHDICSLACGSHNIRSIAAVMAIAEEQGVPEGAYEFQVLYGMAGPIRKSLQETVGRVRLYCPYGELLPGMGYLVRRLLENTANVSFLRQSFVDRREVAALLAAPGPPESRPPEKPPAADSFRNFPAADFSEATLREQMARALGTVRQRLGNSYPLLINGVEIATGRQLASLNPADPAEVIGRISLAGRQEADLALQAAAAAAPEWRRQAPEARAAILLNASRIMAERLPELAAWQILEVGKQWGQAHADVVEAIDFLGYYAREMVRLARGQSADLPGEENLYTYRPKGVSLVIAPWNFPLAISCGMCAAALVTGNTVLYKPSSLSPVTGWLLTDILRQAGVPAGVFNFLPGNSAEIGDYLVAHPQVNMIAFTGSVEVGLHINQLAARPQPAQDHVKRVIAEMGGKNAIIVDDDADLDQAVPQVLYSAFGYQGQKCSACSRVIVLEEIYKKFKERLVAAAESLAIGPAENPANFMGPVIDAAAQMKIMAYVELAAREGKILLSKPGPAGSGTYVPLTVVEGITKEHRLAREEIFGPVLALMRAKDFDEALALANATPYALTGGMFSRSPGHLARAKKEFAVGNLYLNRSITGAVVQRQPFGGFRLSGMGSKAGGPDYLLQFMDPVSISENVMRRGFAPLA